MENILIEERKKITINGATRVISSSSTQAIIEVNNSNLLICGNNIEVTKLDLENNIVEFSGDINSLKYTKKPEKRSLIKRIFK